MPITLDAALPANEKTAEPTMHWPLISNCLFLAKANFMLTPSDLRNMVLVVIFSSIGILVFVAGFVALDKLTPGQMWKEIIEEKNVALAILVGACMLGLSLIIAAALSG